MATPIRVLALCSFPIEAAATRFRLGQFVQPLKRHGIELTILPFLGSSAFGEFYKPGNIARKAIELIVPTINRFRGIITVRKYDLLFVQREAMFFGPAIFERLYQAIGGLPMVLDLDDATYVHYVSPTYGRLGSALKFFGKTDDLIRRATTVTCGNRFIAAYVEKQGAKAVVLPTVVDSSVFKPCETAETPRRLPTIGWIGTHSTFPFLSSILPVLERLAASHKFSLKIIGSGRSSIDLPNIDVEMVDWDLEREVEDFQSIDIGLYPITPIVSASPDWIKAKSGFKAIQYMAIGIPFVMSPVGVCAELGQPGKTHFNATSEADWYNHLHELLVNNAVRIDMGRAGRQFVLQHFALEEQARTLAEVFRGSCPQKSRLPESAST